MNTLFWYNLFIVEIVGVICWNFLWILVMRRFAWLEQYLITELKYMWVGFLTYMYKVDKSTHAKGPGLAFSCSCQSTTKA